MTISAISKRLVVALLFAAAAAVSLSFLRTIALQERNTVVLTSQVTNAVIQSSTVMPATPTIVLTENQSIPELHNGFTAIMSAQAKKDMRQMLMTFVKTVTSAKLIYFMYGGTLLGSYRHHGIVPWDDDIDLIMDASRKASIKKVLSTLKPRYRLYAEGQRWKLYSTNGTPISGVQWRYPFIDICFYRADKLRVWDDDPGYSSAFNYKREWIFPLSSRPYWDANLAAPRDTTRVLMNNYKPDICVENSYNHRKEQRVKHHNAVPCKQLWHLFPFVFRTNFADGSVNETLRIGDRIIHSYLLPQ